MYKIVFFDIDGTLRDEGLGIPSSAITAVKKLQHKGIIICLCTGRTKATLPLDILELPVDYLIAGGGCHIEGRGQLIRQSYFPEDVIDETYGYLLDKEGIGVVLEGSQRLFMNQKALSKLSRDRKQKRSPGETIVYENNFHGFGVNPEPVSKVCLWLKNHELEGLKKLKLWVCSQMAQWETCLDGSLYYEMIQKGCHKGEAVEILCDRLGIEKSQTLAFGDGMNDVDLFRAAGTSVAMASGKKELFVYADAVCEAPMEDGIYLELERRKII